MRVKHLIVGAGPTGLGAGLRLSELGETDFLIVERNEYVGGLSASFTDQAGFVWDLGGHVLFSHYPYYDRVVEQALGDRYLEHQRISRVRMAGQWVPYPFQNNIRHLPTNLQWECVKGLLPGRRPQAAPEDFSSWCEHVFGAGITRLFMRPYNFKVWATPGERMAYDWIGERVSVVNLEKVLENLVLQKDDVAWGPNRLFRFPLHGGTGEIYRNVAGRFKERIVTERPITSIDAANKVARTPGEEIRYQNMLYTGPLDLLARSLLADAPDRMRDAAGLLEHNSVFVAGVGVDGAREDDTCWMYFPEDNCPFYRLTNFHNYSPNNVNPAGKARGLMAETSFSAHKPENMATLMEKTIAGLENTAMLAPGERNRIVSTWQAVLDYGYPVPTLRRDEALKQLIPWLEGHDIYSRGRFGGWKYEVANMDHSLMQGVEWAERMLLDNPETTYKV